jgi:PAS domain-containing protein
MRQLADYLATPVFIVDQAGTLVFYNEAAQVLLGRAYEENGEMALEEWAASFQPTREDGTLVPASELPLVVALREKRPESVKDLRIRGKDGVQRKIAVVAFPLISQQGKELGAVATFWEV